MFFHFFFLFDLTPFFSLLFSLFIFLLTDATIDDCKTEASGNHDDDLMSPQQLGEAVVAVEEKKKRPRMRMGMGEWW